MMTMNHADVDATADLLSAPFGSAAVVPFHARSCQITANDSRGRGSCSARVQFQCCEGTRSSTGCGCTNRPGHFDFAPQQGYRLHSSSAAVISRGTGTLSSAAGPQFHLELELASGQAIYIYSLLLVPLRYRALELTQSCCNESMAVRRRRPLSGECFSIASVNYNVESK